MTELDTRVAVIWAVAFVVVLSVLCSWLLRRSIVQPLQQASAAATRVAEGDLTVRLQARSGDEIGHLLQALDQMARALHHVVGEVRGAGESIHSASAEVPAGNVSSAPASSVISQMATSAPGSLAHEFGGGDKACTVALPSVGT